MGLFNFKKKAEPEKSSQTEMLRKISIMTNLMQNGLLFIDIKERRVVISDTLAVLFLADREKWINFLGNLQMWFVYQASQMGWQKIFHDVEVKAVREARKKFAMLTPLQERTIRNEARMAVDIDQLPAPKLEPYDFIISSDVSHGGEPKIYAVGRYENGKFDMVDYDELRTTM